MNRFTNKFHCTYRHNKKKKEGMIIKTIRFIFESITDKEGWGKAIMIHRPDLPMDEPLPYQNLENKKEKQK
tara:strand:+ start:5890 stop:6102 length:213 start_codon:yes stop_codon:yes gene_type:complete